MNLSSFAFLKESRAVNEPATDINNKLNFSYNHNNSYSNMNINNQSDIGSNLFNSKVSTLSQRYYNNSKELKKEMKK